MSESERREVGGLSPGSIPAPLRGYLGQRLGNRFVIRRFLDRGGMGAVFAAEDEQLGNEVAVKVLHLPNYSESAEARLFGEARALAQLSDPRIVRPLACGRTPGGEPFIVTELLRGVTLRDWLQRRGQLEPTATARLIVDVTYALEDAHHAGFVHRDVKPSNVFLQETASGDWLARLLDFGLSRSFEPTADLTDPGSVVGTPAFMAPEQVLGSKVDGRSDLYALGMVAYLCLTGRLAFGGNRSEILRAQVRAVPEPFPSYVPEPLAGLILSLLEKNPSHRPATATDFRRRLEAWLHGRWGEMELQPTRVGEITEVSTRVGATQIFPGPSPSVIVDRPVAHEARRAWIPFLGGSLSTLAAGVALVLGLPASYKDVGPSKPISGTASKTATTPTASLSPAPSVEVRRLPRPLNFQTEASASRPIFSSLEPHQRPLRPDPSPPQEPITCKSALGVDVRRQLARSMLDQLSAANESLKVRCIRTLDETAVRYPSRWARACVRCRDLGR